MSVRAMTDKDTRGHTRGHNFKYQPRVTNQRLPFLHN